MASSRKQEATRPRVPGRPGRRNDAMDDRREIRVERDGRPESPPSINVSQGELSPMLKPLTLSLSLAVALSLCSVSKAGLHDSNCATCGLASPQGVVASPQGSYGGCGGSPCGGRQHHQWGSGLKKMCGMFQHSTSYEWVLKKKHHFSLGHGGSGCSTCSSAPIYPTSQHVGPSGQYAAPSGQYAPPRSMAPDSTPSCRPGQRPASPRCPPR